MSSLHSRYEPFPWIFWIRITQLCLTVLVIALSAFAASQTWMAMGLAFSFFTVSWSLVYVPLVTWGAPRLSAHVRPNIIVLVFECLSWLWWLIGFATLATFSTAATVLGLRKRQISVDASEYTSSSYDNSGYGIYSTGSSSNSLNDDDGYAASLGNLRAAFACVKVATAFAAINFALFVATFVATCVRIHQQRKARGAEGAPPDGPVNKEMNGAESHQVTAGTGMGPSYNGHSA